MTPFQMPLIGWFMWIGHLCIVAAGIRLVSAMKSALPPAFSSWTEPSVQMIVPPSICLFAIGLSLAWWSRNWAWAHRAARHWSRGVATIIKSERKYEGGTLFYYPSGLNIQFEFEADGRKFISDRVRFGMVVWVEQKAVLDFYHIGRNVGMFYDPDDPERNCLQTTGTPPDLLLVPHLAAFIAGIPIGLIT